MFILVRKRGNPNQKTEYYENWNITYTNYSYQISIQNETEIFSYELLIPYYNYKSKLVLGRHIGFYAIETPFLSQSVFFDHIYSSKF